MDLFLLMRNRIHYEEALLLELIPIRTRALLKLSFMQLVTYE